LVGVALAGLIGLSALIGWLGAQKPQAFDWGLAATVGTAFGTTALAAATAALAWLTKQSVQTGEDLVKETKRSVDLAGQEVAATRDSIEVATRDVETSIQPVLSDVPHDQFFVQVDRRVPDRVRDLARITAAPKSGQAGTTCSVPMRNVGTGVAILDDVAAMLPPNSIWEPGRPSMRIVPPEEIVLFDFDLSTTLESHFFVEARFKDIAGGQLTRTRLRVDRNRDGDWVVVGAALYRAEEGTPFVWSGQWS
jgi:hypothetical protein